MTTPAAQEGDRPARRKRRRRLSHRVGPFLARWLGPLMLRLLGATWRIHEEPDGLCERVRQGEHAVFAIWHGGMLVPAVAFRGCGTAVMISRHADGEVIARIIERLGFTTVRGSTTRGGATALQAAVKVLRDGGGAAFTPDGPRGPRHKVQAGAIFAASRSGAPIIPVGIGVGRARVLRSWDRFRIPLPFAKVALVEGERLSFPPDLEGEALEAAQRRLEEALQTAEARAMEMVGEQPIVIPPEEEARRAKRA